MPHKFRKPLSFLVAGLLTTVQACSKPVAPVAAEPGEGSPSPSAPAGGQPTLDVCALLTKAEIESVLGEPLKEATPQSKTQGGLAISQCFFALPTWSNSVSLQVLQRGSGLEALDPTTAWNRAFSAESSLVKGSGKTGAARKIEGLGEDAYWVGNEALGALSVLHRNSYITISVGGAADAETKIERCSALARAVLSRL